ncbi:hypothetical protein MKW94_024512 [Papaver nudicaule]|uniref:TF-B3 domain-containing protein n=1 Tax=Papaver nudicaule TaxID=74823 RepID=A0AA41W2D6_PAPNU|nr:hypothetical protein [Papaver nudicaule]
MAALTSHNLHFFKVLMPGYDNNLMIPVVVSNKLKELMVSKMEKETALLRTRKSKDVLWKVEVSRSDDGTWCFSGDHWRDFVSFHDLNIYEFLVFEHTGDLLFNVCMYDSPYTSTSGFPPSIGEKEFPSPTCGENRHHVQEHEPRSEAVNGNLQSRSRRNNNASKNFTCSPCFTTIMAESNLVPSMPYLNIPQPFTRSNNLEEHGGSTITLRDRRQRKTWSVKLQKSRARRDSHSDVRTRMLLRDGWSEFAMSNDLKLGDTCLMELDQTARTKEGRIIFDVRISRNAGNN